MVQSGQKHLLIGSKWFGYKVGVMGFIMKGLEDLLHTLPTLGPFLKVEIGMARRPDFGRKIESQELVSKMPY